MAFLGSLMRDLDSDPFFGPFFTLLKREAVLKDKRQVLLLPGYELLFGLVECSGDNFAARCEHCKKVYAAKRSPSPNLCKHLGGPAGERASDGSHDGGHDVPAGPHAGGLPRLGPTGGPPPVGQSGPAAHLRLGRFRVGAVPLRGRHVCQHRPAVPGPQLPQLLLLVGDDCYDGRTGPPAGLPGVPVHPHRSRRGKGDSPVAAGQPVWGAGADHRPPSGRASAHCRAQAQPEDRPRGPQRPIHQSRRGGGGDVQPRVAAASPAGHAAAPLDVCSPARTGFLLAPGNHGPGGGVPQLRAVPGPAASGRGGLGALGPPAQAPDQVQAAPAPRDQHVKRSFPAGGEEDAAVTPSHHLLPPPEARDRNGVAEDGIRGHSVITSHQTPRKPTMTNQQCWQIFFFFLP